MSEKSEVLVLVVLLIKSDGPVYQIGLSNFERQSICFSYFNCYDFFCHMHHVIHVHTHLLLHL
jgi:hypothetical protein